MNAQGLYKEIYMKFKYKKIILWITMATMCIGFVTLSLSEPTAKSTTNVEKNAKNDETKPPEKEEKKVEEPKATVVPPGEEVTEKDSNQEIKELVESYFKASVSGDMDILKTLVSNIKHIDQDVLTAKYEYIEEYKNIDCYVLAGPQEGTYCVYVYSDLKILNIDTLAPGLVVLYVTADEEGKMKIYLDTLDEETQKFIKEKNTCEEVVALSKKVNKLLEEAISSDNDLNKFYEKLATGAKEGTTKGTAEPAAKETKKPTTKE